MLDKLYAQDCWTLLLVFQAMDAAGKDGTIKHVMSGSTRRAARSTRFKAPSSSESRPRLSVAAPTCRACRRDAWPRIGILRSRSVHLYEEVAVP
jgi:hypothetical protein